MSEKKFLNCVITQGVFLFILGIFMLFLPKISIISFGAVLSFGFISYGGYKAINAFLMRNLSLHYVIDITAGLLLLFAGMLFLFIPEISLIQIIGLTGCYFLLESVSSSAFATQTAGVLKFRQCGYFTAFIQFLFGLITLFILPSGAIWLTGIMTGFDFLISGILTMNMFFATKYLN